MDLVLFYLDFEAVLEEPTNKFVTILVALPFDFVYSLVTPPERQDLKLLCKGNLDRLHSYVFKFAILVLLFKTEERR